MYNDVYILFCIHVTSHILGGGEGGNPITNVFFSTFGKMCMGLKTVGQMGIGLKRVKTRVMTKINITIVFAVL